MLVASDANNTKCIAAKRGVSTRRWFSCSTKVSLENDIDSRFRLSNRTRSRRFHFITRHWLVNIIIYTCNIEGYCYDLCHSYAYAISIFSLLTLLFAANYLVILTSNGIWTEAVQPLY